MYCRPKMRHFRQLEQVFRQMEHVFGHLEQLFKHFILFRQLEVLPLADWPIGFIPFY